jgi:hypothetical protein
VRVSNNMIEWLHGYRCGGSLTDDALDDTINPPLALANDPRGCTEPANDEL